MKNFFGSLLGSCLGVFVALIAGFLILAGIAAASIGFSETQEKKESPILKLKLENFIPEKTDNIVTSPFDFGQSEVPIGLRRLVQLIEAAGEDTKIKGIFIENNSVMLGQASIITLMDALKEFKKSGKFIYSYADNHSQSSYLLCSVADSMFLNPQGGIDLRGYGTTIPFFKNMLDKVGVQMNIFYAGNFKSATEPFRLTEMSEFNRLQTRVFLEDMENIMKTRIAENRSITVEKVDSIMSAYAGRTALRAQKAGLIDVVMYKNEVEDFLKKKTGVAEGDKLNTTSLADFDKSADIQSTGTGKDKIAIVYAEGEIVYGSDEPGVISEKKYLSTLSRLRTDDKVKAVVLRVNSPGGSAFTSDAIWHELELIKKAGKPVVASFGDYAASGGYYIAAGADKIVAQPNTLTGSIGVFSIFPDASTLLNDKLGIGFDTVKMHPLSVGFSPVMPLSVQEKELLQESVMEIYDTFLQRVSKGRKLSMDSTKAIAQGRVWTGRKAKEIGLVDQLGDLNDAIELAAKMAKIESYKIAEYPRIEEDMLSQLLREIQRSKEDESTSAFLSGAEEKKMWEKFKELKSMLKMKEAQARLPFMFEFH
ncbi:MAG: signal peptide peptidase SppA [Saprospiraceae bacterium]|jgi:protease-4|nr:signal peptide peptidase SppA [Saprospiraceae bacterium]